MPNLYELSDRLQELVNLEPPSVAEEPDWIKTWEASVTEATEAVEEKIEECWKGVKNLEAFADTCRKEAIEFEKKRKTAERRAARIRDFVDTILKTLKDGKCKTKLFSVWRQKNPPSMVVKDYKEVPEWAWRFPEPEVDMKKLREHLKETGEMPVGVEFAEESYHVRAR